MKILVIHGSPHNGNTLKLTWKLEEAMRKYDDVRFEYLSVNELNVQMCRGCFSCITKGEELSRISHTEATILEQVPLDESV
jgi:multimeric flavodoxin WrbA